MTLLGVVPTLVSACSEGGCEGAPLDSAGGRHEQRYLGKVKNELL